MMIERNELRATFLLGRGVYSLEPYFDYGQQILAEKVEFISFGYETVSFWNSDKQFIATIRIG